MAKTPSNKFTSVTDLFNPARGQLQSMQECLDQLRGGLPASKEEYLKAGRMTHALVKSCFLMLVQRAIDTNNVVLEAVGERPPYRKLQTFLAVWNAGAIDDRTLGFFQAAVESYQKLVKDEEFLPAELYDIAAGILKHGQGYVNQISDFFAKTKEQPKSESELTGHREGKRKRKTSKLLPPQQATSEPSKRRKTPASKESEPLREDKEEELIENYKGQLQTICIRRGLGPPIYRTEQSGTPHNPIWMVAIQYGEETYITPAPISGSKKHAEQITARQVIERLSSQLMPPSVTPQSETFESREEMKAMREKIKTTQTLKTEEPIDIQKEIERLSKEIDEGPLQVSSDLVIQMLGLANNWLSRSNRGKKYLTMLDAPEVCDLIGLDLADLTFRLVRAFLKGADRHKVQIMDSPRTDLPPQRFATQ